MKIKARFITSTALIAMTIASAPALAQASEEATIAEITVTAQRRAESIQDTPVSVSALPASLLETRQMDTTRDIAASVPSLYINSISAGPSALTVTLRGSGEQVGGLATSESPVGIYLDDVYLARLSGANMELADIERIEVLRGPQGTLYGRNTMTGAVKMVTRRPTQELWGRLEAGYGSFDQLRLRGAIAGGITNGLAASASAYRTSRDGWFTNQGQADKRGTRNAYGARIAIATTGDGPFQAQLSGLYTRDKSDGITPVPVSPFAPFTPLTGDFYTSRSPLPAYGDNRQVAVIGNMSYDMGNTKITSITAYVDSRDLWALDFSGGFNNGTSIVAGFFRESASDQWQFSQELQASGKSDDGKLNWIGGVYYFKEKANQTLRDSFGNGVFGPFPVALLPTSFALDTESWAAFGQVSYEVATDLTLTSGLRYTEDRKTFAGSIQNGLAAFPPVSANVTNARKWNAFTPKFGIDYAASDDLLLYANVSRGFRAGGFNGLAVANTSVFGAVYDPETVWAVEGGVKSTLLDGKMTANLAYFHNDLNGLQQNVVVPPASTRTENVGSATVQGLEFELSAKPMPQLNLFASGSLLFDDYKTLSPTSQAAIASATRLPLISKFQSQVGFALKQPINDGFDLLLNGEWNHRSPRFADATNAALGLIATQDRINAGIGISASDDRWQVVFNVRNLTNAKHAYSGLSLIPGLIAVRFNEQPRTWGINLRYRIK